MQYLAQFLEWAMDGSPNQSMRQTAVKSRLIGGQSPLNRHLTGHQQPPRNFAPATYRHAPAKGYISVY